MGGGIFLMFLGLIGSGVVGVIVAIIYIFNSVEENKASDTVNGFFGTLWSVYLVVTIGLALNMGSNYDTLLQTQSKQVKVNVEEIKKKSYKEGYKKGKAEGIKTGKTAMFNEIINSSTDSVINK